MGVAGILVLLSVLWKRHADNKFSWADLGSLMRRLPVEKRTVGVDAINWVVRASCTLILSPVNPALIQCSETRRSHL
jgi:hypothetical protein